MDPFYDEYMVETYWYQLSFWNLNIKIIKHVIQIESDP